MNENKRLRQELEGHAEKALRIQKVKDPDIFSCTVNTVNTDLNGTPT